jgi:hypothetical protein
MCHHNESRKMGRKKVRRKAFEKVVWKAFTVKVKYKRIFFAPAIFPFFIMYGRCLLMMANAIWIKFKFMVWTFFHCHHGNVSSFHFTHPVKLSFPHNNSNGSSGSSSRPLRHYFFLCFFLSFALMTTTTLLGRSTNDPDIMLNAFAFFFI